MKYSRLYTGLGLALAQTVAIVPTVHAQLEEVIVTAERREASLQDTDISMTVFSAENIKEQGIQNYLDLSAMSPNVLMHEMPGKAGGAIAIRGFKNAETISSFEPKVALYLDGVLIAKGAGSVFDVLDLERVEILRGPQGTLYGRNTVGGAVNFITKKPQFDEVSGKVSATLGDYDQQDFKGTINVPLGDSFAFKANVASLQRDGFWKNKLDNNKTLGDKDREVAHLQLRWEPSDSLDLLYSFDMTKIDEGMYPLQLVAFGPAQPGLAPYVDDGQQEERYFDAVGTFMKADIEGHSFTANWEINDSLSLVSITGLRKFEVDNFSDSDTSPLFILHNASGDEAETFTQEFRLVGDAFDSDLEYVLGAFYMDEDIKEIYGYNGLGIFGISSNLDSTAQNEVWALFGEGTYSITDKLDLTMGLRYTAEDKEQTRTDTTVLLSTGDAIGGVVLPDAQQDFDDVSGTIGVTYNWTHDLMTYFKVSKGYVSGGFNPRAPNTRPDLWLAGYEEETVYTYELGWKTTWLDNRLIFNGAIFYNDYSDLQVNQLTATGDNNIDNAGDAEITGMELEFTALITDNFTVGGGYGYLDPEYKTYINEGVPEDPSDDVDLSNNHWAHAPENTFNMYARYVVPDVLSGNLVFRVDYSWVDDYFLLTANGPDLVDGNTAPSYDTWNARIGLDEMQGPWDSTISVALWGRNLSDELWYTSGYDLTDGSLGFAAKAPAPPRTFGVDFILEF
ncbi:TonB-dependent receptor [Mangrovimicrobium sediminis]|uniref:TonB-dependent receptor n=1 Tax=Mangrovimicrobium sediminis TaxID=2562682 RepID=A0A4Z0LZP9_9GAMM|nr:TonB-dependent receptor [Haliea sp. SAOS-164]TGD72588.1 TonB-dependent receptor [Haliea sp. SAOS-164]